MSGSEHPDSRRNGTGEASNGRVERDRETLLDEDQALADRDQNHADADQTASDADQTSSDADEAASRGDQRAADREQRASDQDQVTADRAHAVAPESASEQVSYDESRAERVDASAARKATATSRARTDLARTRDANRRDEVARLRDLTAGSRDRAAEARDRAAARQAKTLLAAEEANRVVHHGKPVPTPREASLRALLATSGRVRGDAAADRARAAADRERAAADRARAAADRRQARIDLQRAQLDSLTGVYTRDLGLTLIAHELDRARRCGDPFVLAFVDVDRFKEINDREGHAAGDALLQSVADALKLNLRSYDPITRVGGDEFLCAFTNTTPQAAERRAGEIRSCLQQGPAAGSITIGLAILQESDTLEDLTARADADMYSRKHAPRQDDV